MISLHEVALSLSSCFLIAAPDSVVCNICFVLQLAVLEDALQMTILNVHLTCEVQVPWTLSMHCSQYQALTQCWCWHASCTAGTVSGTATEAWLAMPPGGEAKVGGVVECQRASALSDDFMPEAVLLNGQTCSMTRG